MADAPNITVNITHLQETLLVIKKYEPELLKALQKDAKTRLKFVAVAVAKNFPQMVVGINGNPSNWYNEKGGRSKSGFPRYDGSATKKVIISSSTGKNAFARLVQNSPSGMIYDSAAKSTNQSFINLLDLNSNSHGKGGKRSRVMFPTVVKNHAAVEKEVSTIVERLNAEVSRHLGYKV